MKKISKSIGFIGITALTTAQVAHGAAGIYDSFVFTSTDAATISNFYNLGGTGNADFDGADLGTFNPLLGDTLFVSGQAKSFKNNGTDVTGHSLFYRIVGDLNFSSVSLPFQWNPGDSGAPGNLNNFGDQQWGGDIQGANNSFVVSGNVLSGLTPGDYQLEVYYEITTNEVDAPLTIAENNSNNNFMASFAVVPEPSTGLLGGLGLMLMLRRRR